MASCPMNDPEKTWTREIEVLFQMLNPLNVKPKNGKRVLSWGVDDLTSGGIVEGEYCEKYGMCFEWTKYHKIGAELEKLRFVGDDLCENVLNELNIQFEDDPLEKLLSTMRTTPRSAEAYPACEAFLNEISTFPSWYDPKSAAIGQEFFRRNNFFMNKMLLHMGLVGGYGSSKINRVLASTRYLIGNLDDTFRRLMETGLCVTEFMEPEGLKPLEGEGWKSCIRVRFLHAKVRRKLKHSPKWDEKAWGVPINQEDLTATLMAFSSSMILASETIVGISETELKGLFMLWRYVGYLLGIHEENNPRNQLEGKAFLESILFHQINPDDSSRLLAKHTLESVEKRTPEGWQVDYHRSLARLLMGPTYAELMNQPAIKPFHFVFHMSHFVGDVVFNRVISRIPILGKMIVDSNWALSKRTVKNKLKGQVLSTLAYEKDVNVENVHKKENDGGKKKNNFEAVFKPESLFEYLALHSGKVLAYFIACVALYLNTRTKAARKMVMGCLLTLGLLKDFVF